MLPYMREVRQNASMKQIPHLIDGGFVDDILSTIGISQSAECFCIVYICW